MRKKRKLDSAPLRVKWCENVGKNVRGKLHVQFYPDAWYIQVKRGGCPTSWVAILELPFARSVDAMRAMKSLIQAGFTSYRHFSQADGYQVKQIAYESLQW